MGAFDDDDNFDAEEFFKNFEEPTEEDMAEARKERDRIQNMPVMLKAKQLYELTKALTGVIDEDHPFASVKDMMMEDAMMLAPKIAGAEGGDLFSLRMESAVLIQYHAKQLSIQTNTLSYEKMVDQKYVKLLREEIEEFRKLFVLWVDTFDNMNDIYDGWIRFSPHAE
jgi:hypothetical protein